MAKTLDIVGMTEISVLLKVKNRTVNQWAYREQLPPKEGVVSGSPAWSSKTIEKWAKATGRWPVQEAS